MPIITFYEVNQETSTDILPSPNSAETVMFDYINDQGAASTKGVYRQARSHGYSAAEASKAMGTLISKNLVTRRNVTVEMDEVR